MASRGLHKFRLWRPKKLASRPRPPEVPASTSSDPAALAEKARDLDAIKKSVEDATAVGAPLWLSYLFLLFYIAIAAGAVTHKDLLLENPVDLPFLSIKLPLKAFFVLAPILFLIVHAYIMAHFALLADKAARFHNELRDAVPGKDVKDHRIREGLRNQLPINVFVQFLAGPLDIREGPFSVLLWAVAWTTLVAGPVLVLLLLQLQFLPYHDTRVSWWHRGILILDLGLIWWLWMKILSGRDAKNPEASRWTRFWNGFLWVSREVLALPLTAVIVLFSVLVATFPGEWKEWPYRFAPLLEREAATELVFGKVDALKKVETGSWPTNTLRLREFNIYEALNIEDPKKLKWKEYTFGLHDRHLEHADFRYAKFDNIDLRGAGLEGASLDGAQLQGAWLNAAELQGASLDGAQLQGAKLDLAQLQGGSLDLAQLQGARLDKAELQGASLRRAGLQLASLKEAQLQGASLDGAQLQGAWLYDAQLQGASLNRAGLQGASLRGAQLKGASLVSSSLWRADWTDMRSESLAQILFADPHWGFVLPVFGFGFDPSRVPGNRSKGIDQLDCKTQGETLASCDPKAPMPPAVQEWKSMLENASVDEATYANALATILHNIICANDANAVHILRGIANNDRLKDTGREAPALIDHVMSAACPIYSALTEADKALLLKIKLEAQKKLPPSPAPTKK